MINKHFNILSYNACGVNNDDRHAEITLYILTHSPSLIVLQEPKYHHIHNTSHTRDSWKSKRKDFPYFPDYNPAYFPHHSKNTGILMYVHVSCTFHPLTHIPHSTPYSTYQDTSTVIGYMLISSPLLPEPIVVGGVYISAASTEYDIKAFAESAGRAAGPLPLSSHPYVRPSPPPSSLSALSQTQALAMRSFISRRISNHTKLTPRCSRSKSDRQSAA